MEMIVAFAVVGVACFALGVWVLWRGRTHPKARPWAPLALLVIGASACLLTLGVAGPVGFWLMLGAP